MPPSCRHRCLAALLLMGLSARPGWAAEPAAPFITVTGEAEAEVPPDTAILTLGVEAEQRTAAGATDEVATKAGAMMAVLRAASVDIKDVSTAALSLEPRFAEDTNGRRVGPTPRAFYASTTYRVRVKPAERAGELASKLVERGANTIDGITYEIADQVARLDALRAQAMRDAKHKAGIYVEAVDLHLGGVYEIMPGEPGEPSRPVMAMRAARDAAKVAAIPAAPGLITLRATVSVRWTLAP